MRWPPSMRSRRGLVRWKLEEIGRQGGKCPLCGKPYSRERPPTVDHIVPRSMGGTLEEDNRRVICRKCNNRKGSRPVWDPSHPDADVVPPARAAVVIPARGVVHAERADSGTKAYLSRWRPLNDLKAQIGRAHPSGTDFRVCKYDMRGRLGILLAAMPLLDALRAEWRAPDGIQFRFPNKAILNWWPHKGTLLWQDMPSKGVPSTGIKGQPLLAELRRREAILQNGDGLHRGVSP